MNNNEIEKTNIEIKELEKKLKVIETKIAIWKFILDLSQKINSEEQ